MGDPLTVIEGSSDPDQEVTIHVDKLERIFLNDHVKKSKMIVLSIVGSSGTGKSFLMNHLVRYLRNEDTAASPNQEAYPLFGFDDSQGYCQHIRVRMTSNPLWLTVSPEEKIPVLLIDTQGVVEGFSSTRSAALVAALVGYMSSVQMYNVALNLNEDNMRLYQNLMATGIPMIESVIDEREETPFQKLVVLVRDWIGAKKYSYGAKGGQAYIQDKLASSTRTNREPRFNFFRQKESFLLPHPGTEEHDSSDEASCKQIPEYDKRFLKCLKMFPPFILKRENVLTKNEEFTTGKDLLDLIKIVHESYEDTRMYQVSSKREDIRIEVDKQRLVQFRTSLQDYAKAVLVRMPKNEQLLTEELQREIDRARELLQSKRERSLTDNIQMERDLDRFCKEILKNTLTKYRFKVIDNENTMQDQLEKAKVEARKAITDLLKVIHSGNVSRLHIEENFNQVRLMGLMDIDNTTKQCRKPDVEEIKRGFLSELEQTKNKVMQEIKTPTTVSPEEDNQIRQNRKGLWPPRRNEFTNQNKGHNPARDEWNKDIRRTRYHDHTETKEFRRSRSYRDPGKEKRPHIQQASRPRSSSLTGEDTNQITFRSPQYNYWQKDESTRGMNMVRVPPEFTLGSQPRSNGHQEDVRAMSNHNLGVPKKKCTIL